MPTNFTSIAIVVVVVLGCSDASKVHKMNREYGTLQYDVEELERSETRTILIRLAINNRPLMCVMDVRLVVNAMGC